MIRVLLDTNVAVSGFLWQGAPRQILNMGRANKILLMSSIPMLLELAGVLARRKFATKIQASGLSISQFVHFYSELVVIVRPTPIPRLAPDPDDDVVIGTAMAAKADLLVTGDKPLLSVKTFESGKIVSVGDALEIIDSMHRSLAKLNAVAT